jgi:hypothetical protein
MFNRMRLVAAAAALLVAAPVASLGTAHAQGTPGELPERQISINGIEPREGVFFAKGKVRPDYENRYATMQRKLKSASSWDDWRKFKTNDSSRYRKEIKPLERLGTICYRVKVKGNDSFATSFSGRVCIKTRRV